MKKGKKLLISLLSALIFCVAIGGGSTTCLAALPNVSIMDMSVGYITPDTSSFNIHNTTGSRAYVYYINEGEGTGIWIYKTVPEVTPTGSTYANIQTGYSDVIRTKKAVVFYNEFLGGGDDGGDDNDDDDACAGGHNYEWRTLTAPTADRDGVEEYACTRCGHVESTQVVSAYGYALNEAARGKVDKAVAGATVEVDFGTWNSFPKWFMEKVAAKAKDTTFVFKFKYNHKYVTVTIPVGATVDTSLDWYGPAKMLELYGAD